MSELARKFLDLAMNERDAARREVEELRGLVERLTREAEDADAAQDAEIARLRALLAGALVPCPECKGRASEGWRVDRCRVCGGKGLVPTPVEP